MKNVFISICFSFLVQQAFPQWNLSPATNNAVCVTANNQKNVGIFSDLKGGVISVWEDYRNDATNTSADIYAQRVDANGNVVWQLNGVAICNNTSHQSNPVIVGDSLGGAIIVWQDYRGTKRNLYAQRIDSLGNVLWTSNGVVVAARNFDQKNPKLLRDGNHGAVIVWQDSSSTAYDIYAQRLDVNGSAVWSTGVSVCAASGAQSNPKAQINSAGDIFITWQDKRNGSDYDIYVQKLNSSGVIQWTANGINICNYAETQSYPKIALDYAGDVIVAWQDKRNGSDYDIYAQRINTAGTIQWSANGISICTATGSQTQLDMTTQSINTGAIITWKDARNGTGNTDIYAQMISLAGAKSWTSNGVIISNALYQQVNPNISGDDSSGAIISYQDSSAGSWDIRAQRVNASGTLVWNTNGVSIGVATGDQINQDNVNTKQDNNIFAFQDKRSGDFDIYVYKLESNGTVNSIENFSSIKNNNVTVYPNPSANNCTFSISNFTSSWNLKITDIKGKEILNEEVTESTYQFTKNVEAGIYFYQIENNHSFSNGKFIIQK